MKSVASLLGLLLVALTGCTGSVDGAHGGGWIPSADMDASHKATFGFAYQCKDADHTLTGVFNYQDHGTGHRLTGSINQTLVFGEDVFACGTDLGQVGVTGACGVVKKGSGGVSAGDLFVVGTGDGQVADVTNDAIVVGLFHPETPFDPSVPMSADDCYMAVNEIGNAGGFYYENGGELGAGNVVAAH